MAIFGDLNEVKILGNITKDIELKTTKTDKNVVSFGVATNRSFKVGEDWKTDVEFHNVVVWGNDAKYLSEKATKGNKILVCGRLQTQEWDKDGTKQRKTVIVADRVILFNGQKTEKATVQNDEIGIDELPY